MPTHKEARARIKINQLLQETGWRFFDDPTGPANIQLEPNVKLTHFQVDILGQDFETTPNGYVDFLLVVTTVQSLLFNNKYKTLFSPTDFDLIISDEAHRSIGGNVRAMFEYFVGYKLGLPDTPKDYLKKFDGSNPTTRDPREFERRVLLDTYRTFDRADGQSTFRYSLLGVKDGYLINPIVPRKRPSSPKSNGSKGWSKPTGNWRNCLSKKTKPASAEFGIKNFVIRNS